MPLNPTIMAQEVVAAIKSVKTLSAEQEADALETWTQVCTALSAHFVNNATIIPAGLPTPLTAPTSGGPVTGTGKLT